MNIYWVAGFLEGEGTFGCYQGLVVVASQKTLWPLEQVQNILGGNISGPHKNGTYDWRINGAKARGLMLLLYPYLSPRRQDQIVKAIMKRGESRAPKDRTKCIHGHDLCGDNLMIRTMKDGKTKRVCLACKARRDKERYSVSLGR